jgi:acyl-CoA thioesterase
MKDMQQVFSNDQFARLAGIELLSVTPGHAVCQMEIKPHHLNGLQSVHGGAIFTLADFAFAVAGNSHGIPAVAINVNISYLKAATSGVLRAEAAEISLHAKLSTYTVRITNQAGDLIALFQGMAYRKGEKAAV